MTQRFALLIGAMKAGTTALYQLLTQHPQIAACITKEPGFWSDPDHGPEDLNAYKELWNWQEGRHEWALEASTSYTKAPSKTDPSLTISRLDEEFRFIYVVRDPLDRLRSQYVHSLAMGWISRPIYEELDPRVVHLSKYHHQLSSYIANHGREKVHVVQYEAFREDPCGVAREVGGFLGLDPSFAFENPGKRNDSNSYRAVILLRILKSMGHLPTSFPEPSFISKSAKNVRRGFVRLVGKKRLAEAELELQRWVEPSPEQAAFVRSELAEDLERFRQDWGIDPWSCP